MKKMFLLFSHTLTPEQQEDAKVSLGITKFVPFSREIIKLWSNVPPGLESLNNYLEPIFACLKDNASSGDYVLVQGDFGATYHMVNFAKSLELIPVYATTERKSVEEIQQDGTVKKTSLFEHKRFRRYEFK